MPSAPPLCLDRTIGTAAASFGCCRFFVWPQSWMRYTTAKGRRNQSAIKKSAPQPHILRKL